MIPEWVNDYIGIPFVDGGRTRGGCDCYGLVRLVLAEQLGIALAPFEQSRLEAHDRDVLAGTLAAETARWLPVVPPATPELGDVAVFRVGGLPLHCGVLVSDDTMLHVTKGCNAVIEPIVGLAWGRRLEGVYRYGGGRHAG